MIAGNKRFNCEMLAREWQERGASAEAGQWVNRLIYDLANRPKEDPDRITLEHVSIRGVAVALGMINPYNNEWNPGFREQLSGESVAGVPTSSFKTITGELIHQQVIEGYEAGPDEYIGDRLVVTTSMGLRNQKITGVKSLGAPREVLEGHSYTETEYEDKYVTTKETKKGRIVSLTEETVQFDQNGSIMMEARDIGVWARQERERTIIRAVIDADASTDPVYRPSGVGEALYATDGSNYNYIGSGNTTAATAFQSASPLVDWTDLDLIRRYRATEVKDDRIDGDQRPIAGLNGPNCVMLLPESKVGTAFYIANQTHSTSQPSRAAGAYAQQTPGMVMGMLRAENILSSPFIDEVNTDDYYYGMFTKQFLWTQLWPLQTFSQGANSEAAFERDTVARFKVRYYGGVTARDSRWVTKVDGA